MTLILKEFQEVGAARLNQFIHSVKASFIIRVWDAAAVTRGDEAEEKSCPFWRGAQPKEVGPIGLVHRDDPVPLVEFLGAHLTGALGSDVDAAGQGDVD